VVAGIHALATFRQDLDNGNSCYIIFCLFCPTLRFDSLFECQRQVVERDVRLRRLKAAPDEIVGKVMLHGPAAAR